MQVISYTNTKTEIPGWVNTLHEDQPIGYAYETETHFVHFYGRENGLYVISPGLTAIEGIKEGTLRDWVNRVFGATNIIEHNLEAGKTVNGIWRPGLLFQNEIYSGLNVDKFEQRENEQALRVLFDKLDELLLYIEPEGDGLKAYSHKTRELLILACTEVENHWKALIDKSGVAPSNGRTFTTIDYAKIKNAARLGEYQISLRNYKHLEPIRPFNDWDIAKPTQSLSWYDAYNKSKHDRSGSFSESSLLNVLNAVCASLVMFCVRFGPFHLLNETKTLSSLTNQMFEINLVEVDRRSFYLPKINLPDGARSDLFVYDSYRANDNIAWVVNELSL